MKNEEGQLNSVNKELAMKQWNSLKKKYEELGFNVYAHPGVSDLVDMVFSANTFFTFKKENSIITILSNMHSDKRAKEVEKTQQYLQQFNLQFHSLPSNLKFESMGDLLLNYETNELFGGYGHRTQKEVYPIISEIIGKPVNELELISEDFYHLDTCMSILSKNTVAIVKEAFTTKGIDLIKSKFKDIVEIDLKEAKDSFAGNCHCPDGKNIILHPGSIKFNKDLMDRGFTLHHIDTSEFIKSGGSVFCMKNQFFA